MFLLIFIFLINFTMLDGLTVGSNSTPSRQSNASFSGVGNKMNGFAAFEGGFTLQDINTTCSFDSIFPVSGVVDMNRGLLYLFQDLIFDKGILLIGLGSIYGSDYLVDVSSSVTAFTAGDTSSDPIVLDNLIIGLHGDIAWQLPVTIQGNCSINGMGSKVTMEGVGGITVAAGGQLTLSNVKIAGLSGSNFVCVADTASVVVLNSSLCLDNDLTFANGSFLFEGDAVLSGTNKLNYTSDSASTIASNATLHIGPGATFYYAPSAANRDLLAMTDETSRLYLDGCTLLTTATGLRLTKGRVFIDNNVTFSCDGTVPSESICFGDGTVSSNDVEVTWLSGAMLNVYGGFHENNVG